MNPKDIELESSWPDLVKSFLFLALAIGFAYYLLIHLGIEDIRQTIDSYGVLGPFIVIILKALTIVVVPLGGTPIYPIAGAIFGFWQAFVLTFIGDLLGSSIAFYLSRIFGRSVLVYLMNKSQLPIVEKLIEKLSETKTFIKARIFFAGFPELFAYAAGFTKVPYLIFAFSYMVVNMIGAAALIAFGDALISGNKSMIVIIAVVTTAIALSGVWWLHIDIKRSS